MKTITFKRSSNPNAVPCLKYVCMVRWDWDIQCVYLFAISYMPMYLLLNAKWKFWTFLRQYFLLFSFFILSALYISQTSYFTQSSPYAYFLYLFFQVTQIALRAEILRDDQPNKDEYVSERLVMTVHRGPPCTSIICTTFIATLVYKLRTHVPTNYYFCLLCFFVCVCITYYSWEFPILLYFL